MKIRKTALILSLAAALLLGGSGCLKYTGNILEVTRPGTPSAAASPCVNVVLPAPRSPSRQTTSPLLSSFASSFATAHVSSTEST